MIVQVPRGDEGWTVRQGVRLGVVIPLAVFGVPLLLLYAYVLLYWSPALNGPAGPPCDPGVCGRPDQRYWWIAAAATAVPAAFCLVRSVRRVRDPRRWWPWPVAVVLLAAAAGGAIDRIG